MLASSRMAGEARLRRHQARDPRTRARGGTHVLDLPPELLNKVFSYLSNPVKQKDVQCACLAFRRALQDPSPGTYGTVRPAFYGGTVTSSHLAVLADWMVAREAGIAEIRFAGNGGFLDDRSCVQQLSWLLGHLHNMFFSIKLKDKMAVNTTYLLQPCLLPSLSRQLRRLDTKAHETAWPQLLALTALTFLALVMEKPASLSSLAPPSMELPAAPSLPNLRKLWLGTCSVPLTPLLCGCEMSQLTNLTVTAHAPIDARQLDGIAALGTLQSLKLVLTSPARLPPLDDMRQLTSLELVRVEQLEQAHLREAVKGACNLRHLKVSETLLLLPPDSLLAAVESTPSLQHVTVVEVPRSPIEDFRQAMTVSMTHSMAHARRKLQQRGGDLNFVPL